MTAATAAGADADRSRGGGGLGYTREVPTRLPEEEGITCMAIIRHFIWLDPDSKIFTPLVIFTQQIKN